MNINKIGYIGPVKVHKFIGDVKNLRYYRPQFVTPPDEFVRKDIDIARIRGLNISHFRLIDSNSIRGVTLSNQKPTLLKELKECGIKTIIDLRQEGGDASKYAALCKEHGLDYFNLKLKVNMPIFNRIFATKTSVAETKAKNQEFISNLPHFFDLMNNSHNYMACQLGLHRTDLAVTMNYLLNPKEPLTPPTLTHMFIKDETNFTNKYIGAVKNLVSNLSENDKTFLGFSKDFDENFSERIVKLKIMNNAK